VLRVRRTCPKACGTLHGRSWRGCTRMSSACLLVACSTEERRGEDQQDPLQATSSRSAAEPSSIWCKTEARSITAHKRSCSNSISTSTSTSTSEHNAHIETLASTARSLHVPLTIHVCDGSLALAANHPSRVVMYKGISCIQRAARIGKLCATAGCSLVRHVG